jgi:hypothetical protein
MGYALKQELEMRELRCGECGINFAAPEFFMAEKQRTGAGWYCPNGHARAYRETDVAKLQKELEAERQRVAMERQMRYDAEVKARKAEQSLKRQTKRVNAGVCPHCNRTFQQLARHMQCMHATENAA